MLSKIKKYFTGVLAATILAVVAYFIAPYIPGVNGVILAFIIAIILGNLIKMPSSMKEGVNYSASKILEFAIIFLAFSISFQSIAKLGWLKFLFVLVIIIISLVATILLAKRFKTSNSTSWLVGFGTAICGSSAIAAVAPMISKSEEDTGIAIATVNLLGSVGMIVLPFLLSFIFSDANDVGFLLGANLQSVGNVAGAGYGLSQEIGDTALTVKMARVALLSPAVIFFSFLVSKSENESNGKGVSFKLPYYLWIFIGITIITSLVNIPEHILEVLQNIGKFLLTIAMAAIGLKVSFKTLWQSGKMAMGFGTLIFLIQVLASVGLILIF